MKARFRYKGGKGSGHWGHAGRKGKVGGSVPSVATGEVGVDSYGYSQIFSLYGEYGQVKFGNQVMVTNMGKDAGISVSLYGKSKKTFPHTEGMKALRYAERLRKQARQDIIDRFLTPFNITPGEEEGPTLASIMGGKQEP
jgi:hypothetical protein